MVVFFIKDGRTSRAWCRAVAHVALVPALTLLPDRSTFNWFAAQPRPMVAAADYLAAAARRPAAAPRTKTATATAPALFFVATLYLLSFILAVSASRVVCPHTSLLRMPHASYSRPTRWLKPSLAGVRRTIPCYSCATPPVPSPSPSVHRTARKRMLFEAAGLLVAAVLSGDLHFFEYVALPDCPTVPRSTDG